MFSFSKYESDEKMNNTLRKSLTNNINDFLKKSQKKGNKSKKNSDKEEFTLKHAIELLKYCIENNEMFAVKYDKKDKKMKTEDKE